MILDTELTHPNIEPPFSLYTKWIGGGLSKEDGVNHRPEMMFTFEAIGGIDGVRAWLNLRNDYAVVIDLLMSNWYAPPLYQEQRYFSAVTAVETLIRIQRKEQGIKLVKGLVDLAKKVGSLFEALVGDILTWAQEVVRMRDHYVVHPGLRGNSDGYRLYLLSESIYLLVIVTLLRECEVPMKSFKSVQTHQHFTWLGRALIASSQ
jgi:hypothetical protein